MQDGSIRQISTEAICRVFAIPVSLVEPYSLHAQIRDEYRSRFFEAMKRYAEHFAEQAMIYGTDMQQRESQERFALPSFDEVLESAAQKWQPGRVHRTRPGLPVSQRAKNKARRKQADKSRKRNR